MNNKEIIQKLQSEIEKLTKEKDYMTHELKEQINLLTTELNNICYKYDLPLSKLRVQLHNLKETDMIDSLEYTETDVNLTVYWRSTERYGGNWPETYTGKVPKLLLENEYIFESGYGGDFIRLYNGNYDHKYAHILTNPLFIKIVKNIVNESNSALRKQILPQPSSSSGCMYYLYDP